MQSVLQEASLTITAPPVPGQTTGSLKQQSDSKESLSSSHSRTRVLGTWTELVPRVSLAEPEPSGPWAGPEPSCSWTEPEPSGSLAGPETSGSWAEPETRVHGQNQSLGLKGIDTLQIEVISFKSSIKNREWY